MIDVRDDWTKAEARALHDLPLTELLFRAQEVHRLTQPRDAVQLCSLLSIKTGACQEDCAYCPQSSKYDTGLQAERLMDVDDVLDKTEQAIFSIAEEKIKPSYYSMAEMGKEAMREIEKLYEK